MKRLFILLCAVALSTGAVAQNIDSMLRAVRVLDQGVREELVRIYGRQPLQLDSLQIVSEQMQCVDRENQRVVFPLLEQSGWPAGLSSEANEAIWFVIQHASHEQIKRFLPLVEEQALKGTVEMAQWATMLDRVLMHEGKPQRYGTQTKLNRILYEDGRIEEGGIYLWPLEDAEHIDLLRAKVGLGTLDDFFREMHNSGFNVIWDKSRRVEDF